MPFQNPAPSAGDREKEEMTKNGAVSLRKPKKEGEP